jgi:hypothetical protein
MRRLVCKKCAENMDSFSRSRIAKVGRADDEQLAATFSPTLREKDLSLNRFAKPNLIR